MDYQHYFPRTSCVARLRASSVWKSSAPLQSRDMFCEILILLQDEQNAANISSPADYVLFSEEALQDILALKGQEQFRGWEQELNFLQFFVASGPAIFLDRRGEYVACHDWFNYSLADIYPSKIQQEVETKRLFDFMQSKNSILKDAFFQVVIDWIASLFHYGRVQNANRGLINLLYDCSCAILKKTIKFELASRNVQALNDAVTAAILVGNWGDQYDVQKADLWVTYLHSLYSDPLVSAFSRARIAIGFSTKLGSRTHTSPDVWARLALAEHASALNGHERLQLLCSSITTINSAKLLAEEIGSEIGNVRGQIFDAIDSADPKQFYHLDRLFGILGPAINVAANSGDAKFLYWLLANWYGVPIESIREDPPVFILPNAIDGSIIYCSDKHYVRINSTSTVEEMTDISNAALGTFITVQGSAKRFEGIPDRPGIPNASIGPVFASTSEKFYGLGISDERVKEIIEDGTAMIILPWAQHPIQSLIYRSCGSTLPIAVSLQQSFDDRKIRRVVIWAPNQTISERCEIEAVSAILQMAEISVEICAGADARTKERFVQTYQDPSVDVLWIISHGEYDHWNPHETTLVLSSEDEVNISLHELASLSIRSSNGRRLLVLNVCDGAASAMVGGLNKIGFAQSLACRNQAVVSHLWPVESMHAAAFGACLAIGLAKSSGFFKGYEHALYLLHSDCRELIDELQDRGVSELIERLSARNYRSNSTFAWGSPIFFE